MKSDIRFLYSFLNSEQKSRFLYLLILMTLSSFFEIVSILGLIEYINYLSEGSFGLFSNFINKVLIFAGIDTLEIDLQNLSFFLITLFFLSSTLSLITVFLTSKFSLQTGGEIESGLFEYYLKRDYLFHIQTTSSKLLNNIFELVKRITRFVMYPAMIIISKLVFIIPLIIGLLIYKTEITFFAIILFIGIYFLIFQLFRKKMVALGEQETNVTESKYSVLNEGFGGIKEVKILNKFNFFKTSYNYLYEQLVKIQVQRDIIGKFPKNLIELVVIFSSVLIILYLFNNFNFDFNDIILKMSAFLIIAYKIIPSLQQIYYNLNIVKNHLPAVNKLSKDLKNSQKKIKESNQSAQSFKDFNFLEIKNISFNYKNNKNILKSVSFKIKAGQKIALTGLSGSGKTTLINILLGIINVYKGKIFINDELLKKDNLRSWQKNLGYVSQSIFLSDKSIRENIAFGVPNRKIDNLKIKKLIKICKLNDVIKNLPKKENTLIGERGIRFSGGQQQRLGIARALYTDPSIIILDEATNALDKKTENQIIKSILKYKKKTTIIMISHRIDIIKKFDKIIFLNKGIIEGFEEYKSLYKSNLLFRELASDKFKKLSHKKYLT